MRCEGYTQRDLTMKYDENTVVRFDPIYPDVVRSGDDFQFSLAEHQNGQIAMVLELTDRDLVFNVTPNLQPFVTLIADLAPAGKEFDEAVYGFAKSIATQILVDYSNMTFPPYSSHGSANE